MKSISRNTFLCVNFCNYFSTGCLQGGMMGVVVLVSLQRKSLDPQEVSIVSDQPGWMVQKRGLLSCKKTRWTTDLANSIHCKASLYDNWDIIREDVVEKHFRPLKLSKHCINTCFPQSEIPEWFNHQCMGPSLAVQLSQNFSIDSDCSILLFPSQPART